MADDRVQDLVGRAVGAGRVRRRRSPAPAGHGTSSATEGREPPRGRTGPSSTTRVRSALPGLAGGPHLSLWRAPTDNDRIGGLGALWEAWGVDRLERRLVSIDEAGDELVVRLAWRTGAGIEIAHEQRLAALAGDALRVY